MGPRGGVRMRHIIATVTGMILPRRERRPRHRYHLWWWFLVPIASAGFATFAIIGYAGLRLRQSRVVAAAGLYFALELLFIAFSLTPAVKPIAVAFMAICWLGGTVHALVLSDRFSNQLREQNTLADMAWSVAAGVGGVDSPALPWPDSAIDDALARIQRRRDAHRIVVEDLPLAAELRIGRPDLERTYDDGGLVDVNHVPADTLVAYLDMAPEVAHEIVGTRAIRDGFTSADDLFISVDCLNPARLDMIRDRMIFIPSDLTSTLRPVTAEHPARSTAVPVSALADRGREDLGGSASTTA